MTSFWCVNFEQIPHIVPVFLLLTLSKYVPAGSYSESYKMQFFQETEVNWMLLLLWKQYLGF